MNYCQRRNVDNAVNCNTATSAVFVVAVISYHAPAAMQSFSTNNCRSICIALFVIEPFYKHLFVYNAPFLYYCCWGYVASANLGETLLQSPSGCTNQAMCLVVASVSRTKWETNASVCVCVSCDRQTVWRRSEICRTSLLWQEHEEPEWPQTTCPVFLRNNVTQREFAFLFLLPNDLSVSN